MVQRAEKGDAAQATSPTLLKWSTPRLVRTGTVAEVTSKIDVIGRNDGGSGTMKRT